MFDTERMIEESSGNFEGNIQELIDNEGLEIDKNMDRSWATKAGGTSLDQALAMSVDENGNSYIAGDFE